MRLCGFGGLWRFSAEEAPLGTHSAQRPSSVWMASFGHVMGQCKVKCSLCSVQQVWRNLQWVQRHRDGQVVCGCAVLLLCVGFKLRKRRSAATAQRVLPLCDWPGLGTSWGTARSNTTCAGSSRCGGVCTGGCGRAWRVVCGGCAFAGLWRFPEEKAALGNHSTQSPASGV